MKKFIKPLVIIAAAVIVVGAIVYRLMNIAPSTDLAPDMQAKEIIESGGCLMCHAEGGKLPFYANMPIAKGLIKEDIRVGQLAFNIQPAYDALSKGEKIDEVSLAKIEYTISKGNMPKSKYYLMHWGSSISSKEKTMIQAWAKETRAKHYFSGVAAAEFANEAVQPIGEAPKVDPMKVQLGNILFHSPLLSGDNTISCASCHDMGTAGIDNKSFSEGINGQIGGINAPTTFNAYLNFVQFWDGRAADLAAQADGPPFNPIEMGSNNWEEIIAKLKQDKNLSVLFTSIYPEGYTSSNVRDAIAEFEKTLTTPNSRFDKYLKGEKEAITAEELEGYELFKDLGCATCHVGQNMGGQSFERMGIFKDYFKNRKAEVSVLTQLEDNGRMKETKNPKDVHYFKVPSLRNIALTSPYLHDATASTLEEAVKVMAEYQHDKNLSKKETTKLVAFLNTLTGEYNGNLLTNKDRLTQ